MFSWERKGSALRANSPMNHDACHEHALYSSTLNAMTKTAHFGCVVSREGSLLKEPSDARCDSLHQQCCRTGSNAQMSRPSVSFIGCSRYRANMSDLRSLFTKRSAKVTRVVPREFFSSLDRAKRRTLFLCPKEGEQKPHGLFEYRERQSYVSH